MIYYGLFTNGLWITNHNLSNITQLADIEYIVREEYDLAGYPKYTIVNSFGLASTCKIGEFELLHLSSVGYISNVKKYPVTLTIRDTRLNEVFNHTLYGTNGISLFPEFVMPFLKELNAHGSYLSYKQSMKIAELQEDVARLTKQLKEYIGE